MTAQRPPTLPTRTRVFALIAMVVAGLLGISSAGDVTRLWHLSDFLEAAQKAPPVHVPAALLPPGPDGKVTPAEQQAFEQALQKTTRQVTQVEIASLNGMRQTRMGLLIALAIAAALAFAAAGQVLMPSGFSREGTRRMLVGTLLAAAVLRILDGAQTAVVGKRIGTVVGRGMAEVFQKQVPKISPQQVTDLFGHAVVAACVAWTALVAGSLLLVFHHFRSAKVRALVAEIDQARTSSK